MWWPIQLCVLSFSFFPTFSIAADDVSFFILNRRLSLQLSCSFSRIFCDLNLIGFLQLESYTCSHTTGNMRI